VAGDDNGTTDKGIASRATDSRGVAGTPMDTATALPPTGPATTLNTSRSGATPLSLPAEGVDMPWVGRAGSHSMLGFLRNSKYFWERFQSTFGDRLSPQNRARIASGESPVVDDLWVKSYPQHAGYLGEILEHHHIGQGPRAVPLPETLHDAYTVFHPQKRVVGTPAGGSRPLPPQPTQQQTQAEIQRHTAAGRIRGPGISSQSPPTAPQVPASSLVAGQSGSSGTAPRATPPPAAKAPGLKASSLRRPTLSRSGGRGGNLIGLLIVLAASFLSGKAEAATQQKRYEADFKSLEPELAARLSALADRVATMQILAPDFTVYLNFDIEVATFEQFIATPQGALLDDLYMGTTLGPVDVSHRDIKATRNERFGSAREGGTNDIEITTYSQPLEQYPIEELIAYARANRLDLRPLRTYLKSWALLEESRAVDVSLAPGSQTARDRYLRALQMIDREP
jgi:hypothetical protein